MGETTIPVIAQHAASGAELRYDITVDRAGAIVQAVYGKASNTGALDVFSHSVAVSGNGDTSPSARIRKTVVPSE